MIKLSDISINYRDVLALNNLNQTMFLRLSNGKYCKLPNIIGELSPKGFLTVQVRDDSIFADIKYKLVEWVKRAKDPLDRVMHFEHNSNYEEYDRLVEARKTVKEKQEYKDQLLKKINYCHKHNIECGFLRDELKQYLKGTFGG